jgi:hypothetical protein
MFSCLGGVPMETSFFGRETAGCRRQDPTCMLTAGREEAQQKTIRRSSQGSLIHTPPW